MSEAIGARDTLVAAGLLGAAATAAALLVPGVRAIERAGAVRAVPAPARG